MKRTSSDRLCVAAATRGEGKSACQAWASELLGFKLVILLVVSSTAGQ